MSRSPNHHDLALGQMIRARRVQLGWSQQRLGDGIGVTFQQIQKYERGTNRISAGRLTVIANLLALAPDKLLTGGETFKVASVSAASGRTAETNRLLSAFERIPGALIRIQIVRLVESLASGGEGLAASIPDSGPEQPGR